MSSIVQIKDSAYDGMQSLRVYGNTVQNLWVNPSGTKNGVTVTANADGSITISGSLETATSGSYNSTTQYVLRPGSTYTLSVDRTIGGVGTYLYISFQDAEGAIVSPEAQLGFSSAQSRVTFTVPTSATSAIMGIAVKPNTTPQTGTYRVMLNEGSTAKPWCPPGLNSVGDGGSVEVVTAGKNLIGITETTTPQGVTFQPTDDGGIRVTGTNTGDTAPIAWLSFAGINSPNAWGDIEYTPIPPGNYVLSYDGPSMCSARITIYKSKRIQAYPTEVYVDSNHKQASFTLPESYYCLAARVVGSMSAENNGTIYLQLEKGSTATDFEPYKGGTTTSIDLQGHTLNALPDGTRDELHIDGGGNVVLKKRVFRSHVEVDDLTAQSTEYLEMSFGTGCDYVDGVKFVSKSQRNDFAPVANADIQFGSPRASVYTLSGITYFRVGDGTAQASAEAQLESVKSKVGTKKIDAMWALAEHQTVDLGTIDLPKLRKKPLVNTIWANGTAEGTGFSLAPEIDCEYNRWSTYCDGFKTHGKHSYFDMGCCVAARDTGTPEKKSVTATVPYMSGYYDFSKLYGAIAFEARQLMYRFEFVEDSREELQQKKSQFLEWLSQVHDEEITDDDIPGRHFIGSLSEWEFEEGEEGQSGSLEVTFNCQPFLEADEDTTKMCNAGSNTVTVKGQPVNAYAKTSSGTATIQIGGVTQSVGTTEIRLSVQLQPGDNAVTVTGSPVVLRWKELTA